MESVKEQHGINQGEVMRMKSELGSEKFMDFLHNTDFPEQLSENWKQLAKMAIRSSSPLSLKITLQEFLQVLEADPDGDISFFEFGCLSNSIEVISPKESGMEQELYKTTIAEAVGHIEFYQKEINTIRKKIETDVEREISAKVTAMKGITDSNGTGGDGKSHLTVK